MSKYKGVFWVIGLCAFVAFMCSGFSWLLGLIGVTGGFLGYLENIANLVLTLCAFLAGWFWLSSSFKNGTLKIVLQVLFVIFTVLAVCGIIGLGI